MLEKFEYTGNLLPAIPIAGGFSQKILDRELMPVSGRHQIIIKSGGLLFGRPKSAIKAIERLLEHKTGSTFLFYSVTPDIEPLIRQMQIKFPNSISYRTAQNPMSHVELLEEFAKSKIYLGISISDGISTAFLESLISGCYPIQSNTSCAEEWISKGFIGTIVPFDSNIILAELLRVESDFNFLERSALINVQLAKQLLSEEYIFESSRTFYQLQPAVLSV